MELVERGGEMCVTNDQSGNFNEELIGPHKALPAAAPSAFVPCALYDFAGESAWVRALKRE